MKRFLSIVLSLALAIPMISIPTPSHAWTFSDMSGHWSETDVYRAVSYGIVRGYEDNTFRPDRPVTRAEFTNMVNNTFGNKGTTSITFTDVPYYAWYYDDVAKGLAASYIAGYNNKFSPNDYITRQDAAVILDRVLPYESYAAISSNIRDKSSISSYAVESVAKLYSLGYMTGNASNYFRPKASLTRAEAAKILSKIYNSETIVTADTTIKSKGTTLRDKIYSNDVTITSAVGNGDVDLENCVVLGTLNVNGGGTSTVTISNSRISNANISKSSSAVRVLLTDRTVLNRSTVSKKAILETEDLTGGLNGIGFNHVNIKASADVTLRGTFNTVNVNGSSVDLIAEESNIETLNVSSSGKYAEIDLDDDSDINTANIFARCDFTGDGIIQTMNVSANNVTFERDPRYVNVTNGYKAPNGGDYESGYDADFEVVPGHKEDNIDVDTDISIYFPTATTKYNGSDLKGSDIESLIYIRKGSATGSRVPFTASISKSKKIVNIMPDRDLEEDTRYYVVIPANNFLDSSGHANQAQTTYFYTGDLGGSESGDENVDKITFYPADDAEGCSTGVSPTITFPYPIETYSGEAVTGSFLEKTLVLREGGSGGTKVGFTASISSSKKTITLKPDSTLKNSMNYYISIPTKKLRSKDDNTMVPATSVTWKTAGAAAPTVTITPETGSSGVPLDTSITVKFSATVYPASGGTLNDTYIKNSVIFTNNTSKKSVDYYVLSYSGGTFILKPSLPLDAGSNFTVTIPTNKFKNNTGAYAPSVGTNFTTTYNFDTTELKKAVTEGKVCIESNDYLPTYLTGNDDIGRDVFTDTKYVLLSDWEGMKTAVETGEYLLTHAKSETEIINAISTITSYKIKFDNAADGYKEITDTVRRYDEYIASCKTLLDETVYSANGKNVEQDVWWVASKDTLTAFEEAIEKAEEVRNSSFTSNETESVIGNAQRELQDAMISFMRSRALGLKPDSSELSDAIEAGYATYTAITPTKDSAIKLSNNSGETDLFGNVIAVGARWIAYTDYEAYGKALDAAVTAKSSDSQEVVNKALETLKAATATFEAAIKTKEALAPNPTP